MEYSLHDLLALLIASAVIIAIIILFLALFVDLWFGFLWFCEGSHRIIYK